MYPKHTAAFRGSSSPPPPPPPPPTVSVSISPSSQAKEQAGTDPEVANVSCIMSGDPGAGVYIVSYTWVPTPYAILGNQAQYRQYTSPGENYIQYISVTAHFSNGASRGASGSINWRNIIPG